MPPVGRLGQYEIKGLLLSFLHIIKTLSEGGVTQAFLKSPSTRNRGSNILRKGLEWVARLLQCLTLAVLTAVCFLVLSQLKRH